MWEQNIEIPLEKDFSVNISPQNLGMAKTMTRMVEQEKWAVGLETLAVVSAALSVSLRLSTNLLVRSGPNTPVDASGSNEPTDPAAEEFIHVPRRPDLLKLPTY